MGACKLGLIGKEMQPRMFRCLHYIEKFYLESNCLTRRVGPCEVGLGVISGEGVF